MPVVRDRVVRRVGTNLGPTRVRISSLDVFQRGGPVKRSGTRMELFEQIRRDRRDSELSIRELAQRHGVHRRTVRHALASAVPPPRKPYRRRGATGNRRLGRAD